MRSEALGLMTGDFGSHLLAGKLLNVYGNIAQAKRFMDIKKISKRRKREEQG